MVSRTARQRGYVLGSRDTMTTRRMRQRMSGLTPRQTLLSPRMSRSTGSGRTILTEVSPASRRNISLGKTPRGMFSKLVGNAGGNWKRVLGGGVSIAAGLGALAVGVGTKAIASESLGRGIIGGMIRGMTPGAAYPSASGKFGTRAGPAGPVGIEGMRFNFRRK